MICWGTTMYRTQLPLMGQGKKASHPFTWGKLSLKQATKDSCLGDV